MAGDLTPSVQITVTDDSGNVIEGAEITIDNYVDNYEYTVSAVFSGSPTSGAYLTITPSGNVSPGETVTIQANGLSNITTSATRSDGGTISWTGATHSGTFDMPENDVVVTVNCTVRP